MKFDVTVSGRDESTYTATVIYRPGSKDEVRQKRADFADHLKSCAECQDAEEGEGHVCQKGAEIKYGGSVDVLQVVDAEGNPAPNWQSVIDPGVIEAEAIETGGDMSQSGVEEEDLEDEEEEEEEEAGKEGEGDEGEEGEEGEGGGEGEGEDDDDTERAWTATEDKLTSPQRRRKHRIVEAPAVSEDANLTSNQRRLLNEQVELTQDEESTLLSALDIQDVIRQDGRDPSPEEALTLWKASDLRRRAYAVRRRMGELARSRPAREPQVPPELPPKEPPAPVSLPVIPGRSPIKALPAPEKGGKPAFSAILDGALSEADGMSAAANAGMAAAGAAVAPTDKAGAAAEKTQVPASKAALPLDKAIEKLAKAVAPDIQNLKVTAAVQKKMFPRATLDQWIPKNIRDKHPEINWKGIFDGAR